MAAAAKSLPTRPDNDTLLELYSYFKPATEGDVSGLHQVRGTSPVPVK
ncbi:MAG: acyl-CoA-binding protein [Woeseiaceae bacterium]